MNFKNQKGSALVLSLILIAVIGGVIAIYSFHITNLLHQQQARRYGMEEQTMRDWMIENLDCRSTLGSINLRTINGSCSSTSAIGGQVGPYLPLKRRLADGTVSQIGTPTSNHSAIINGWSIRISCSSGPSSEKTLIVRSARLQPGSTTNFVNNPLSGKPLDWSRPNALWFGGATGVQKLCTPDRSDVNLLDNEVAVVGNTGLAGFTVQQPVDNNYYTVNIPAPVPATAGRLMLKVCTRDCYVYGRQNATSTQEVLLGGMYAYQQLYQGTVSQCVTNYFPGQSGVFQLKFTPGDMGGVANRMCAVTVQGYQ